MSLEYDSYDEGESPVDDLDEGCYCEVCKWWTDVLRDIEQQRREYIDKGSREQEALVPDKNGHAEELFLAEMRALDHRRNAALCVLAEHQQTEHQ